jgi:hypothetical protein
MTRASEATPHDAERVAKRVPKLEFQPEATGGNLAKRRRFAPYRAPRFELPS